MSDPTVTEAHGALLEAIDRRRPGRVHKPTDELVQMFRDPDGVVRAVWDRDLPGFDNDLLDEVVVIPSTPESRENEKVVLLRVAAIVAVIAAVCIMFGG